jgi:hypothetical protein
MGVAQTDFPQWLALVRHNPLDFGYAVKGDSFMSSRLGVPVPVYSLMPPVLDSLGQAPKTAELMKGEATAWYFPVELRDTIRFFMGVSRDSNHRWRVATIGDTRLAASFGPIRAAWPDSAGYRPVLFAGGFESYFFALPQVPKPNLTPIRVRPICANVTDKPGAVSTFYPSEGPVDYTQLGEPASVLTKLRAMWAPHRSSALRSTDDQIGPER